MITRLLSALTDQPKNCKDLPANNSECLTVLPQVSADDGQLQNILSIVFGTLAAVAIVVIVLAAINFANAGSDTEKISRQKRAILYALVGLALVVSAEAVTLTLLGRF
jgi:uncharacterized membrane protein YidH (DUF202 family)